MQCYLIAFSIDLTMISIDLTTRTHKDSQGLTRTHKDSQGLTRIHKYSQGFTRTHKDAQGLPRIHAERGTHARTTKPGNTTNEARV